MTRPATRYSGPIQSTLNPVTARSTSPTAPTDDTFSQAACVGLMDWMFPEGRDSERARQIERARGVCSTCLLVDTCAREALERDERHGVWGGIFMEDPYERATARRKYRASDTPTQPHACEEKVGTVAGHKRHSRVNEQPCDACREAFNAYNVARRTPIRTVNHSLPVVSFTEAGRWLKTLRDLVGAEVANTIVNRLKEQP
jgi:hypothetical protein